MVGEMALETFRRGGVTVSFERSDYHPLDVTEAELRHMLERQPRRRRSYGLDYKGYPGMVDIIPVDSDRWRYLVMASIFTWMIV